MSSRLARTSSIAALVAGTVALAAPSFAATPGTGGAASHYLAEQLAAGGHGIASPYGGVDTGLTADTLLALGANGSSGAEATATLATYANSVSSYVGTGGEEYAGATAKSIIVAVAAGKNPASFGGVDLVTRLKGLETTSGRFSDKSSFGDYTNGLTQALALIAEKKAGIGPDAKAVSYLLSKQCSNGGFAMDLSKGCSSDPDSTSFAVQALAAVGGQSAAVAKADAYLRSVQGADGGVVGGTGAESENSNSTGLAAVAFTLAGDKAAAAKATSFVNSLQFGCAAPASLQGAVAYNKADFTAQKALGAKATGAGNETRATAQAALAFAPVSYATVTISGSAAPASALSCGTTSPSSTATPTKPTSTTSAPSTSTKPSATSTTATTKPSSTSSVVVTKPTTSSTHSTPAPSSATSTATSTSAPVVPTGTTSAPTSTATAPSSSAPSTGPKVDTDRVGSSTNDLGLALAGAAAVIAGGGAVVVARRR